jgi:protein-tyrosine-phosphatase
MHDWKQDADELRARHPKHILFICYANSARSQMAEGIARSLAPQGVRISSAGSIAARVHPLSIQALSEIGIDISANHSKCISELDLGDIDAVITLCSDEACALFPDQAVQLHWPLPDPSRTLDGFRQVRDELLKRIRYLFAD